MKTCTKCGKQGPPEQFLKRMNRCKECHREANRKWRANNPDYFRAYYLENRPEPSREVAVIRDGKKKCHTCGVTKPLECFNRQAAGPGGRRTTCKSCRRNQYLENPEPARARAQQAREADPERMRKWRLQNPERVAASHLRRQRRTLQSFGVSLDYLADLIKRLRTRPCHYCGGSAGEVDHVVPLSRGGPHHPSNMVPCCRSCNASKNNRLPGEWQPPTRQTS